MQRITRQLAAALVATFIALGLSAGIAGAGSEQRGDHRSKDSEVSQRLAQKATTSQKADSEATSWQFVPVNFNGGSSHGTDTPMKSSGGHDDRGKPRHGGGDVKQTNDASAESSAKNEATTIQWAEQDQDVDIQESKSSDGCSRKCEGPKRNGHGHGSDCSRKCDDPKRGGHGYRSDGKHDEYGCGTCSDHGKGSRVSQELDQKSETDQKAYSDATSHQFVPVNANLTSPPKGDSYEGGQQAKGYGCGCSDHGKGEPRHDGGDVKQTNDASAESSAKNEATTVQWAEQDQDVDIQNRPTSSDKGRGCGCSDYGKGSNVSQELDQDSETKQYADSKAESWQFVPVNVNAPISVFSSGSNNGDVQQTNDASADSSAKNESFTGQFARQDQDVENDGQGGDVRQDADQDSHTYQKADSEATSHQFVPVNVNAPISIGSHGSNNGDVEQTNDASTTSRASNEAFTLQGASQHQNVE